MTSKKNIMLMHLGLFAITLAILGGTIGFGFAYHWSNRTMFGVFAFAAIFPLVTGGFFVYRLYQYCVEHRSPILPVYADDNDRIDRYGFNNDWNQDYYNNN